MIPEVSVTYNGSQEVNYVSNSIAFSSADWFSIVFLGEFSKRALWRVLIIAIISGIQSAIWENVTVSTDTVNRL